MCDKEANQDTRASESLSYINPDYLAIKEVFEATGELSDDQLDLIADTAVEILKSVLELFGEYSCTIDEYIGDEGELILNISQGDLAILIGHYGRVLESLQTLVASLLTKRIGFHFPLSVDIESYKARRKEKIVSLACNMAKKAAISHCAISLKPMPAYERRLVHTALMDNVQVETHSEGRDPHRYVIIKPR